MAQTRIIQTNWQDGGSAIRTVRHAVFIDEQGIAPHLEWEPSDATCRHVLALDATGTPVGTGRLLPDGMIGRMAVLEPHRRQGIGSQLLTELIDMAKQSGFSRVYIHAQVDAMDFYRRFGFSAEGEWFQEAGIDHQLMVLDPLPS